MHSVRGRILWFIVSLRLVSKRIDSRSIATFQPLEQNGTAGCWERTYGRFLRWSLYRSKRRYPRIISIATWNAPLASPLCRNACNHCMRPAGGHPGHPRHCRPAGSGSARRRSDTAAAPRPAEAIRYRHATRVYRGVAEARSDCPASPTATRHAAHSVTHSIAPVAAIRT
jgi:hypothetical protein